MTTAELRKIVKESKYEEWLNSQISTFNFPYIGFSQSFKGIIPLNDFLNTQLRKCEEYGENIPNEFKNSKVYFENIKRSLINIINQINVNNLNIIAEHWGRITQQISSTGTHPILFDIPETEFIYNVHISNPEYVRGSYNFIVGNIGNQSLNDKSFFTGAILAYEFLQKNRSDITKRRAAEKKALSSARKEYYDFNNEAQQHLNDLLKNTTSNYKDHLEDLNSLKEDKEKVYDQWFEKTEKDFQSFNNNSLEKIKTLEQTYEELLRLKKPADYWNSRGKELKTQGWISLGVLSGLVIAGSISLYCLLWYSPEAMLNAFFDGKPITAVRWSVIFITFISFLFFGIKALTRVTFSSFHLARDAEERERLTYVYLALTKDSSIEKEDRHLILQSLFSRADTGLLKDDSSPTMPGSGSMVDKIFSK
ncbi:MAG: DUF6161 domain-containing protein [Cytophagaceae bacterium]